ncbi:MAG: hypothetical protein ACE5PM_01075 [Candidatus Hydrothermarchaeales archaeon]
MKKFVNTADKVDVILSVFKDGEKLKGKEIARRIREKGYNVDEGSVKMFIYYHMLYQYVKRERVNGVNHYCLLT